MDDEESAILVVPFYPQVNETSCGIAAFQMVYKFFKPSKLSKFSQEKVYHRLRSADPIKAQFRVRGEEIIALAKQRGLNSGWGRVSTSPDKMILQVRHFVETEKIPLIVCQRWKDDDYLSGHFRVVIGIDSRSLIFHDPNIKTGGERCSWPVDKFMDYWKTTGPNVTGGVAIWVAEREIADPLDPGEPNQWAALGLWQP